MTQTIIVLLVLVLGIFLLVPLLRDQGRLQDLLNTVEKSTGVDLEPAADGLGEGMDFLARELGDAYRSEGFQRALKKYGAEAMESINAVDWEKLRRQARETGREWDEILDEYFREQPK